MGNLSAMALQVLILGSGIYLMLRFLGRTRGGGILRGLVVALAFGAIGLWGLTEAFGLEELGHILQSVAGFVVVILVIVFQPELRRGIAQLGEHSLLGKKKRLETLSEVAQAAISMSKRKRGALIAFEGDFSLGAYVDNAVRIDAEITRLLLESIFHPGSALHDGAVVLRRDRVAAAACLFPLTENPAISRSTGTRHRAALGLTEETDSVTLVVSEETGSISLCRGGLIESDVAPDQLETRLRGWLGDEHEPASAAAATAREGDVPRRAAAFLRSLALDDLGRKAAALGIALALLFIAHRAIHVTHEFTLQVLVPGPGSGGVARPSEIAVQLPSADYRLLQPAPEQVFELIVSGSRAQVDALGPLLSGEIVVRPEMAGQVIEIDPSDVFWSEGVWEGGLGLRAEWKSDPPPILSVERHARRTFALAPEHLVVDAAALDARYRPDLAGTRFLPGEIEISGPEPDIARLGTPELPLRLAPIVLSAEDTAYRRERVDLASELVERRFALVGQDDVRVTLAIVPALRPLGTIEKEIQLVTLGDADAPGSSRWTIPANAARARFGVRAVGLMPARLEPDSPAWQERATAVMTLLRDSLRVFSDAPSPSADDPRVAVHWILRDDWLAALDQAVGEVDPRARVELLLETDSEILLQAREGAESGAGDTASGD